MDATFSRGRVLPPRALLPPRRHSPPSLPQPSFSLGKRGTGALLVLVLGGTDRAFGIPEILVASGRGLAGQ
jgi:hypothetical protein